MTVREAFAVCPALNRATVVVLRNDGRDVFGAPAVSCLLAATVHRDRLDRVQWHDENNSAEILNAVTDDILLNMKGRTKALHPVDLSDEPEITSVAAELGFRLPASYVALMRTRNGGIPRNTCCPSPSRTTWAEDHVAVAAIMGIGREQECSLAGPDFVSFVQALRPESDFRYDWATYELAADRARWPGGAPSRSVVARS